jgi:hypothetical protein
MAAVIPGLTPDHVRGRLRNLSAPVGWSRGGKSATILLALIAAFALLGASCADISPYRYIQTYTMIEPVPSADKAYEDGKISIRFLISEKRISFHLRNKTKQPVTLNWDEATYVHIDGARHPVAGVDAIFSPKRTKPGQADTFPGKTSDDFAAPVKNVEKLEEWTWYLQPLFDLVDDGALENKGKIFGLDLPIRVEGTWKVYQFRFKVLSVIPIHQRV